MKSVGQPSGGFIYLWLERSVAHRNKRFVRSPHPARHCVSSSKSRQVILPEDSPYNLPSQEVSMFQSKFTETQICH